MDFDKIPANSPKLSWPGTEIPGPVVGWAPKENGKISEIIPCAILSDTVYFIINNQETGWQQPVLLERLPWGQGRPVRFPSPAAAAYYPARAGIKKDTAMLKIAYFGIDALQECLAALLARGCEVVRVFTTEDDGYDSGQAIRAIAREHDIPCRTTRVTREEIRALEEQGVAYTITAGYPWYIPVSRVIRQVNFHPSCLPVGRGPWPMPTALLRGVPSGVTLHKISEGYDEGDILLCRQLPLDPEEDLVTLMERIRQTTLEMLETFLADPDGLWERAVPQGPGEYWPEPGDEERLIRAGDPAARARRILRAFRGYGVLCQICGVTLAVTEAQLCPVGQAAEGEGLCLPLADGVLVARTWQPYFRELSLGDRPVLEEIRRRYPSELSDFTFPVLYCWRNVLGFRIFVGEDFYLVKSSEGFLCPVGEPRSWVPYLRGLRRLGIPLSLRFCDNGYKAHIQAAFPTAQAVLEENDCDYIMDNQTMVTLAGSHLAKRRNAVRHYTKLAPPPEVEEVTAEKLSRVLRLSAQAGGDDRRAELEAIRHFARLGLHGVLIRRGEEDVGFAFASAMTPETMQGHFTKTIDRIRGANLFVMQACVASGVERYGYLYTNMEDDMGDPGLREFKRSLRATVIPAYTITIPNDLPR